MSEDCFRYLDIDTSVEQDADESFAERLPTSKAFPERWADDSLRQVSRFSEKPFSPENIHSCFPF